MFAALSLTEVAQRQLAEVQFAFIFLKFGVAQTNALKD